MAAGGRLEDGSLEILQSMDDDLLLDTQPLPHHSLHAHFRPRFHPLPTVIIANLLLFIHVSSVQCWLLLLKAHQRGGDPVIRYLRSWVPPPTGGLYSNNGEVDTGGTLGLYGKPHLIGGEPQIVLRDFISKTNKVVFVTLAFLTGVLCSYPNPNEDKCPENYTNPLKVQTVIILGKVSLWILHLLLDRYIQYHHSKVRSRGYSQIYRSTRHLKALPLMVHSSGNTVLLLLLCVQHSFPEPGRLYLELMLAVLALELLCSLSCLLLYAVKIRRFNRAKPQPDVLEEEKISAYPRNTASETGFRTISSLEEIVEKQADIIAYLKRHNALLSKRLLDLASQPARM